MGRINAHEQATAIKDNNNSVLYMYIDVGWGGGVNVLQRRHYEDIAVDVVLKAAKKVFEAKTWNAKMVQKHRLFDRDLVCPDCAKRGYASGKYDEYQCED